MILLEQLEYALSISLESGFGREVTLTDPSTSDEVIVSGQVIRTDVKVDPETGVKVIAPGTAVTLRLSSCPAALSEDWLAETTDIQNSIISGKCKTLIRDYTLGTVTFIIED